VAEGESRNYAERLAADISRFPNACMLADRRSALAQAGVPVDDAMRMEFRNGIAALSAEGIAGADRFARGLGRHGDFDDI
jgi:enoyl-CoA hydratase